MADDCKCNLTITQALILTDLAHGIARKQITFRRGICQRTVSQHIKDAKAKLGAETSEHMIAIFVATYGVTVSLMKERIVSNG